MKQKNIKIQIRWENGDDDRLYDPLQRSVLQIHCIALEWIIGRSMTLHPSLFDLIQPAW